MPALTIGDHRVLYTVEGEGFPLVLMTEPPQTLSLWEAQLPLLGELCRTIVYAVQDPAEAAPSPREAVLHALLDTLGLERIYLAGYAASGLTALQYALHYPERLEGLIVIRAPEYATAEARALATLPLHAISVPTLVLVGEHALPDHTCELLTTCLPRCRRLTLPNAGVEPLREQPQQLGQALLDFLVSCERQRNLVRGASLLL